MNYKNRLAMIKKSKGGKVLYSYCVVVIWIFSAVVFFASSLLGFSGDADPPPAWQVYSIAIPVWGILLWSLIGVHRPRRISLIPLWIDAVVAAYLVFTTSQPHEYLIPALWLIPILAVAFGFTFLIHWTNRASDTVSSNPPAAKA